MEKSSAKNPTCPICKKSFGLLTKKSLCTTCNLFTCLKHIIHKPNFQICEQCEKSKMKSESFPDTLFQIQTLRSQLVYLKKDKKKYKSEIASKNDQMSRLLRQTEKNSEIHCEKVQNLEKKITEESQKISSEEKLVKYLEQSLIESKKNEFNVIQKLNSEIQEVYRVKMELENAKSAQISLIKDLDVINAKLRGLVPYFRLDMLCCSDCKLALKSRFVDEAKATEESFLSTLSTNRFSQEVLREGCACKTCLIF